MIRIVLLVAILLLLSNVCMSQDPKHPCVAELVVNGQTKTIPLLGNSATWSTGAFGTYLPAELFKGCQQLTRMYVYISPIDSHENLTIGESAFEDTHSSLVSFIIITTSLVVSQQYG